MAKSFREKLAEIKPELPSVQTIQPGMAKKWGQGTIVMPTMQEVDALMKKVPKGKLLTINQMREYLATKHGATISCPIVTGIFARIAAGAAGEWLDEGRKRVTPYWRTLKGKGEINPKYPGGLDGQRERLEAEGHSVEARGKKMYVVDFERKLIKVENLRG
jgi:alkylated DNA nucleotide flippase Atl1